MTSRYNTTRKDMSTMVDYLDRGGLSTFNSSTQQNFLSVCSATINQTYYHNGSGILPVGGDVVKDGSGNWLAAGYYRVGDGSKYIRIMSSVCVDQGLNDSA